MNPWVQKPWVDLVQSLPNFHFWFDLLIKHPKSNLLSAEDLLCLARMTTYREWYDADYPEDVEESLPDPRLTTQILDDMLSVSALPEVPYVTPPRPAPRVPLRQCALPDDFFLDPTPSIYQEMIVGIPQHIAEELKGEAREHLRFWRTELMCSIEVRTWEQTYAVEIEGLVLLNVQDLVRMIKEFCLAKMYGLRGETEWDNHMMDRGYSYSRLM